MFFESVFNTLHKLQMTSIFLKAEQYYSMEAVYNGYDVFVWLLTGYEKSLCYQAVPLIMDFKLGLVGFQKHILLLVILVALKVDQVTSLRKCILHAALLSPVTKTSYCSLHLNL